MIFKKADDLLDDEFKQSYFKQLVGRFTTLGASVTNPEARKRGEILAAMPSEKVDWNDIYELETLIVKLEPEDELRQHLWSLRAEYKKVAPNEYAAYEKSSPPDSTQAPIEKVRADAARIQEELNWYYTVLWVQETFRGNLLKRVTNKALKLICIYVALGLMLVLSSGIVGSGNGGGDQHVGGTNSVTGGTNNSMTASNEVSAVNTTNTPDTNSPSADGTKKKENASNSPPKKMSFWEAFRAGLTVWGTYFVVLFAGTIGALISVLRRIQQMTLDGNSDTNLVELEKNSASIDFSPLLGAVFALLLLFMIMSGLLSGGLFPTIPKEQGEMFFLGCVPSGCTEVAKLIVWAFIAGFAEKFVPDALDRLQSRAASKEKETPGN